MSWTILNVSIPVHDLEKSKQFYEMLLGTSSNNETQYQPLFKDEDNILKFFIIFLVVQIVGDLTFYSIVSNVPVKYDNKWTKFFKNYGKTSGLYAVVGDSIYIAVWTLVAYLIRNIALDILLAIVFTFLFVVSAIAES